MYSRFTAYINKICMTTVKVISLILMIYLFLLSTFSTSIRSVRNYSGDMNNPEWGRYTYFLRDDSIKNLPVFTTLKNRLLFADGFFMLSFCFSSGI